MADISEFQSNIDAPTYLKKYNIVIARAYNGRRADNMMPDRRDYLRKYDFKGVGWYLYLVDDVDPTTQAKGFIDVIGKLKDNEFPIVDCEEGGGDQSDRAYEALAVLDDWAGFRATLYSGENFLETQLGGWNNWNRPLWVANYSNEPKGGNYVLWQYSSNTYYAGITPDHCDSNKVDMSTTDFMKAVRSGKPASGGGSSSSGGGGSSSGTKAPKYPYPSDEWMGQPSNNPNNHSGCYPDEYPKDTSNVKTWQGRMRDRGWSLSVDGCFGPETENVCRQFQAEKGLSVDGAVGPETWGAAWTEPITNGGGSSSGGGGTKPDTSDKPWRDKSANWHDNHLGITEDPPNSNCDTRSDGIRNSQDKTAGGTWLRNQPWCGCWAFMGLYSAGKVKADGSASWMASVASIEDYAKQGKGPFRGWTTDGNKAKKGDLVVLFGRGQHVGTVRSIDSGYAYTWEGNTSSGSSGSQSNGGGSYKRSRSRNGETYGYALVKD